MHHDRNRQVAAGAVARHAPWAAGIGLAALGVSWAYSMPPVRLLNSGFGELVTSLVVVGAVPLVGMLMRGVGANPDLWGPFLVLLPIHVAMMLAFELPDLDSDTVAGKTVLAVRLGRPATKRLAAGLLASAWLLVLVLSAGGALESSAALATLSGLPLAVATVAAIDRNAHLLTSSAVGTLVLVGAGLLAARIT